jgi:hypothetical protein
LHQNSISLANLKLRERERAQTASSDTLERLLRPECRDQKEKKKERAFDLKTHLSCLAAIGSTYVTSADQDQPYSNSTYF